MGGEYLLTLNTHTRPIVNKYREGKLKRTLDRELKERETAVGEGKDRDRMSASVVKRGRSGDFN